MQSGPTGDPLPEATTLVADESPLNHPSGFASLSFATSIAVADRVLLALGSSSGRSYGRLCMRIDIQEREAPMRFCNRYVGDGQLIGGSEIAIGGDATTAATLVERFDRSQLHVDLVRATLDVHEGMRFAVLRDVSGPKRVTPGERIKVRIKYQRPREAVESSTFRVRVPRSLRPGRRTLRLNGTGPDPGDASFDAIFGAGLSPEEFGTGDLSESITSVEELAEAIRHIHRYDGIRATFRKRRDEESLDELVDLFGLGEQATGRRVFRHNELRIGGRPCPRFWSGSGLRPA